MVRCTGCSCRRQPARHAKGRQQDFLNVDADNDALTRARACPISVSYIFKRSTERRIPNATLFGCTLNKKYSIILRTIVSLNII